MLRKQRLRDSIARYSKLDDIFSNPAYSYLRSCRNAKPKLIEQLSVGDVLYTGQAVCDGFYASMTSLKQCDMNLRRNDPHLSSKFTNYDHIVKICQDQPPIPPVSLEESTKILKSLKKNVKDIFSITALHYLNAGQEGIIHYNLLLNAIISDVNNANIDELNVAHGNIFYKGHQKDRSSDRSYRTISTCPFLAKSVDCYLRDLYLDKWNDCQADTQYQGTGSSHELASLLVTEVIQHSQYTANKPVFLLALDAQSAFDRCLRQILCSELYKAEVPGTAILFMDNRLASRKTVYEWEGTQMGPATDGTGFEQGGLNSSDFYKLYNNDQLTTAQSSSLCAEIGSDVMMSNDIYSLFLLVKMTEKYCHQYRVKLEPKKTKLLAYSHNRNTDLIVKHAASTSLININNTPVMFTSEAEHVGVVRHIDGNMPNIVHRIAEHKKALGSVQSAGLARGHRGSPAAALKVHQLYCTPRLLSGLASLVLSKSEISVIDSYYQNTLQQLQKLHSRTPRSAVLFQAGSLPGEALLHLRQLSLFSMICHLPDDPLHKCGQYALTYLTPTSRSWFHQIRNICLQYGLPHPLNLLETPLTKEQFKKLAKTQVVEHWKDVLSTESFSLDSLRYFDPRTASLLHPHPLWKSAAGSSYECSKGIILARMASGRYRTEMMCRFWSANGRGYCLADTCHQVQGDLEHLLVSCPALEHTRHQLHSLWCRQTAHLLPLHNLIVRKLGSSPAEQVKFILDSLSSPQLVHLIELYGQTVQELVLYLTRTWAFCIHRQKEILMGRWPHQPKQATPKDKTKPDNHDNDNPDNNDCSTDSKTPDNNAASGRDCNFSKSFSNNNVAGNTSFLTREIPATTIDDLPVPPPSQFDPAVHVQHSDMPPIVVPRPRSYNHQPIIPAIPSSAQGVDSGEHGEGGGQVAPGGRPCGGADCQLSVFPLLSVGVLPPSQCSAVSIK